MSHEVAPFAKVGGLADVAGSLPKALKGLGHDVRVFMPAYQMILDHPEFAPKLIAEFPVAINPVWTKMAQLWETKLGDGVPVYLLGTDEWFCDTHESKSVYLPGSNQHLFFTRGVLAACRELGWIPHVFHANDWHTGLLPVVLREGGDETFAASASVFTIHNLAYQGEFPFEILEQIGLPSSLYNMHQLETYGAVNFLKAGSVFADQVNTVSPRYAEEIQTPEFGCRLEGLMTFLAEEGRLSGILNGIDFEEFNPAVDPALPAHFSAEDVSGKVACREGLLAELGLESIPGAPVIGVVSRLSSQKGMDLMIEALDQIVGMPAQLIVQGLGDSWLAERFREAEQRYPNHVRFVEKFDAALANRVYAGSDLFLMPSAFEPCGLGQLIALRYGTLPIVRETGGLANTVFEGENGFVFQKKTAAEMIAAVSRAVQAYRSEAWSQLVLRALNHDSRWTRSALVYEAIYEKAVRARQAALTV